MTNLADVADVIRQPWVEDAHCGGSGVEFVDIPADVAESLVWRYCHACVVVGHCRELGDTFAPHRYRSVYGARVYEVGERA